MKVLEGHHPQMPFEPRGIVSIFFVGKFLEDFYCGLPDMQVTACSDLEMIKHIEKKSCRIIQMEFIVI